MNRVARSLLSSVVVAAVVMAPTAAGAKDSNVAVATNETDGAAVVEASVQYRKTANGVVDEENLAYAAARCAGCQTVAAAFQLVLVTKDVDTLVPHNEAFAGNLMCEECLTWASAKQVVVSTGGPASLSDTGHGRLKALEDRLEALEANLPSLSLTDLQAELDGASGELLDIAQTEVVRDDGGANDAKVVATRTS